MTNLLDTKLLRWWFCPTFRDIKLYLIVTTIDIMATVNGLSVPNIWFVYSVYTARCWEKGRVPFEKGSNVEFIARWVDDVDVWPKGAGIVDTVNLPTYRIFEVYPLYTTRNALFLESPWSWYSVKKFYWLTCCKQQCYERCIFFGGWRPPGTFFPFLKRISRL